MDAITVKVSALLVMVQALVTAKMDYVTLSTHPMPDSLEGYLRFEAYREGDPNLAFVFPGEWLAQVPREAMPESSPFTPVAAQVLNSLLQ